MPQVKINEFVEYERLEAAVLKAAEEMRLKGKPKDNFKREYRLGSVSEKELYEDTTINLKRMGVVPKLTVTLYKGERRNYFWIRSHLISGKNVLKFLDLVSDYV